MRGVRVGVRVRSRQGSGIRELIREELEAGRYEKFLNVYCAMKGTDLPARLVNFADRDAHGTGHRNPRTCIKELRIRAMSLKIPASALQARKTVLYDIKLYGLVRFSSANADNGLAEVRDRVEVLKN
jgi:hypothetical protein